MTKSETERTGRAIAPFPLSMNRSLTRPLATLSPIGGEGRVRGRAALQGFNGRNLVREILTPALSRRERENHPPPNREPVSGDCFTRVMQTAGTRRLFPLPQGEGQGEGECVNHPERLQVLKPV
jgi:hypothetical protein